MLIPENIKQSSIRAEIRVELNPHNFSVFGGSGADLLVSRVMDMALRVAHFGVGHTLQPLVSQLDAPEATGRELGEFQARFGWGVGSECRVGLIGH